MALDFSSSAVPVNGPDFSAFGTPIDAAPVGQDLAPADENAALTRLTPTSSNSGAPTFVATDPTPASVLDNQPARPGEFDMRKNIAARTALDDPRNEAPSMKVSNPKKADINIARGEALADAPLPIRAAAKTYTGISSGLGGIIRAAGDVTGSDTLSTIGAGGAAGAQAIEQGMGQAGPVEGFGPKSPLPYLKDMAEGAGSSMAQSAIFAAAFGPGAVIPLMSLQTAGQEYDQARNAGLDPAAALAGAVPKGIFEAVGEKFTGLDKVAAAMGTLLQKGASDTAKRSAGQVLLHAGVREIPGEVITYLGQTGTDLLPGIGLKQDLTMSQFIDGLRDTVVQAAMMGGAMGGAGGHVAHGKPAERQPTAADLVADKWGSGFAPKADPIAPILSAPTVDAAIAAATEAVNSSGPSIAEELQRIRPLAAVETNTPEPANVRTEPDVRPVAADTAGSGLPQPGIGLEAGVGVSRPAGPALDAGSARIEPASGAVQPAGGDIARVAPNAVEPAATWFGRRGDGYLTVGDAQMALPTRQRANPDLQWSVEPMPSGRFRLAGYAQQQAVEVAPASFQTAMNPTGTLTVQGDPQAISAILQPAGVTKFLPTANGVLVAVSQAQQAQAALAGQQGERAQSIAQPAAQAPVPMESLGATGPARGAGGKTARAQAYEANPFKAFLGKHGLSLDLASEFAPGRAERQASMVRGYGPIFRRSGQNLDLLAQAAAEEGFLPPGSQDADKLYQMIAAVFRGQRIAPLYAEGAAEQEMQSRIDRASELEEDAAAEVSDLSDASLFTLEESDDTIPWGAVASNVTEADAMRSLGFTEQEIHDATAEGPSRAQEAGEGDRAPVEAASGQAQADRPGRDQEAGPAAASDGAVSDADSRGNEPHRGAAESDATDSDRDGGRRAALRVQGLPTEGTEEGETPPAARIEAATAQALTAPTAAEVVAQQDRTARAERDQRAADKVAEAKAKADAELPEFKLQGSDRAADANPDQVPMFARGEPARSRPRGTITFSTPLTGPSGAKLTAYTWQWKPIEFIDARGEERTQRISDWEKPETNAETGRDVVHQFIVDGKPVSLESATRLMGFDSAQQAAPLKATASAVKTLARLRMQEAEVQQALEAFDADSAQVAEMKPPPITGPDEKGWYSMGETSVRQIESGSLRDERRRTLLDHWRSDRLQERGWKGGTLAGDGLRRQKQDLQDRIKRAEKKVGVAPGEAPVFARKGGIDEETRTANFKRWSNDAPMVTSAAASTYNFKSGQKVVLEAFHGAKRPDRIGNVFKRSRATSGPMAFFTSAPELASSYAQNKGDTSLANEDQHYATWFKYKPPGERSAIDIDRAWYRLDSATKDKIAALAPRVMTDDTGENIILGDENETRGNGGYDHALTETRTQYDRRGNPLKALVTSWLESGSLFDQEEEFSKILALAGFPVKDVTFDSPHAEYPSVYKTFVFMQKPLVTSDIPQEVRDALSAAAKRDRSRAEAGGADMWAKNTRTLRDWVANFLDRENTDNAYVWTSIPDKVTDVFKSLGYDGIIDWSGKGGGHQHPVYIPFEETQVKSATGNKGTFDRDSKNILFRRGPERGTLKVSDVRKTLELPLARLKLTYAIYQTTKDAAKAIGMDIPSDAKGFHWKGKVHLIAENLRDPLQVQETFWHEVNHAGLNQAYGTGSRNYENALRDIFLRNKNVRDAAKAWMDRHGKEDYDYRVSMGMDKDSAMLRTKLQAVDEALAELAGRKGETISGLNRLIAAAQEFMRSIGLNKLADWLENKTDAQALSMILTARNAVMGDERGQGQGALAPAFVRESRTEGDASYSRGKTDAMANPKIAGTKAVDANGKPALVYHGTPEGGFSDFSENESGIFFSSKPSLAEQYMLKRGMWRSKTDSGAIYPAYLDMKNPLVIDALGKRNDNIPVPWAQWKPKVFGNLPKDAVSVRDAFDYAREHGHDGLIVRNVVDTATPTDATKSDVYAVMKPEQVISKFDDGATGNNGDFDPGNPSIQFSRATTATPPKPAKPYTGPGAKLVESTKDVLGKVVNDALLSTAPMSAGSDAARAIAKDYANAERLARWQWSKFDEILRAKFSPEKRKAMWEAADEQNVLLQQGKDTTGKGLDRLPADQRKVMDTLHAYGEQLLQRAKDSGMFKGEGLPYWTPRMAVMIGTDGEFAKIPGEGKQATSDGRGRNVTTSAQSLKQRKYLTADETEAAANALAKERGGKGAELVRDIRTMPMAMARLERAIAGRELVNQIKDMGKQLGTETTSTSAGPAFFTVDHPAFTVYRPRMTEVDGKMTPVLDQNGDMQFDRTPLYISKDFEGPLKAILSEPSGELYKAMMTLKGKAMGLIMYSPLIHNAVEWGRALPIMPGKVLTFQIYFAGNRIKNDPLQMAQAIKDGMVPIGHRGNIQDITGLAEEPELAPGRSWTAKLLGGAIGAVSKEAGTAVKKGVDAAGDFWHNTLLWDRVGDLQAGLYGAVRTDLINNGMDEETAGRISAHFANRYAGALPNEAMSANARKIANFVLFSRSFTLGNLGVMKDMLTGFPPDVAAQIQRDAGDLALRAGKSVARRKAIAAFGLDIALLYVANALIQSAFAHWKDDEDWDKIEEGYVKRFKKLANKAKENPADVIFSPMESLSSLTPNSENEPGKEERIKFGKEENGTQIYMRTPTGKIGEEFKGWLTSPLDMLLRKQGTFMRPITQTIENDKGFGQRVYNPDDKTWAGMAKNMGRIVWNFMSQQVPVDSIQSGVDWAQGHGTDTDKLKVLGPLVGLTFSKGAPGGPEVGEMYHEARIRSGRIADAMPDVRHAIKVGDTDKAVELMEAAGMTPAEIRNVIKKQENPASRLSPQAMKKFNRTASEEAKDRMGNYGR